MFPCERWDEELLKVYRQRVINGLYDPHGEIFVIETKSNTPVDEQGLMVVQIMSRARYESLGYALYPEYESMYADNDFTEQARKDGCVIDARHLVFEHRHPFFNTDIKHDMQYVHENDPKSYKLGEEILKRRRKEGFGKLEPEMEKMLPKPPKRVVAFCTPGKSFDSDFLFEFGQLYVKLFLNGGIIHAPAKSSNVYDVRMQCLMAVDQIEVKPDYYFWIDSDQLNLVEAYEQLQKTLDENPKIDIAAGWTYMLGNTCINAGFFYRDEDKKLVINKAGVFQAENLKGGRDKFYGELLTDLGDSDKPFQVDWCGFGCVLMRANVIEKLQPHIFTPIYFYDKGVYWVSDDTGFCLRCLDKGINIYLDPKAYVRHMKEQEVLPVMVSKAN